MPNRNTEGMDSGLIMQAFLLDTYLDEPDRALIVNGDDHFLLSYIYEQKPELREAYIRERAEVYRKLGWKIPQ